VTTLIALHNGERLGKIEQNAHGNFNFTYDAKWLASSDSMPLSLSLPLAASTHHSNAVENFLWGLLPDNEMTLRRWASTFQVSARNPLGLLARVGEDCAGAVQFMQPERLAKFAKGAHDKIAWLSEVEIACRLKLVKTDNGMTRTPEDLGQFSLAGAQAKIALLNEQGRWGVPSGRIPTTHILKPPSGQFDSYAENEHFCMQLARAAGLPVVASHVVRFDDELAICVARFDRDTTAGQPVRVHQEDFCQALGIHPSNRYQNQGGPGPQAMADLLRTYSTKPQDDIETLFFALVFNWLIGGTDAHGKNYSLLIGSRGQVRLAPLYDLSSIWPYPTQIPVRKTKMSMKIGSHYGWWEITANDWKSLAKELHLDADFAATVVIAMARALPDLASNISLQMQMSGLDVAVVSRLVDGVASAATRGLGKFRANS
jgi:serine/threonine-protein kinase HipA